jgi:hypothetical protein
MKWKEVIYNNFILQISEKTEWKSIIEKLTIENSIGLHLAIFNEPFLSAVLTGNKTIESRFTTKNIQPFGKVYSGDIILVKESGGKVLGFFIAKNVNYWHRSINNTLFSLKHKYDKGICSNLVNDFWETKRNCKYGTLISIDKFEKINPFSTEKNDRSGWVVIKESKKYSIF